MVEQEPPKETSQSGESILAQDFVEQILTTAQENLRAQGYLSPVLMLHMEDGQRLVTELELPETSEEKEAYFTRLGRSFRRAGQRIHEAVFVAETWYVDVREAPDAFTVRTSQHPARREAISIVGRNAQGTRHTFVMQSFSRDSDNQPVFEPISDEMAHFNVPIERGTRGVGLLDHLFARRRDVRKRPRRARRRRRRRRFIDWAEQERAEDLEWIRENLHVFWPVAEQAHEELGRGAIVIDTTSRPTGEGHPFGYFTQEMVEQYGDEDTQRLVAEYDPGWEIVTVLVKPHDQTSTYRIGVLRPDLRELGRRT